MTRNFILAVLLLILGTIGAKAHEYYLMPESFTPSSNKEFAVRHRLGKNFKGNEMPFINKWNIRSEIWRDGEAWEIRGLDGDRPALKITETKPGLFSVIHQSNVDFLTFSTWEEFESYVVKNGMEYALAPSQSGAKPKLKLKEGYARYAKTLISIDGQPTGADLPTGMKIELMALEHPLSLKAKDPMPVQLLYEGRPLANALIKVFVGVGNDFTHTIRTDTNGKAMIPADGPGPYLLNAIYMTDPQGQQAIAKGAHWESFWATLTFQRAE